MYYCCLENVNVVSICCPAQFPKAFILKDRVTHLYTADGAYGSHLQNCWLYCDVQLCAISAQVWSGGGA